MFTLFELCGADSNVRFSPFVWRIKLILEHKSIPYKSETVTFIDKSAMEGSGFQAVPVIRSGDMWLNESFKIARYLDEQFPEKPIFAPGASAAQAALLNNWVDRQLVAPVFPMIAADIVRALDDENHAYFRNSRESRLGSTLEDAGKNREEARGKMQSGLGTLESILSEGPYFGGNSPDFLDLCVLGSLMWPYCVTEFDPIEGCATLTEWRERMFDAHPTDLRSTPRAV